MMNFERQVSRLLDDEHHKALELLGRVEQAFGRATKPAQASDPELQRLAGTFARHIQEEVTHHFDFEERELFPRLADAGEADIGELLTEEHADMRAVADELLPLARAAANGTLDSAGFDAMRRGVLEMVERQVAHIQKETMALLPIVEDLIDEETDRELAFAHAS